MNMNKIIKKPSYKKMPILAIICCLILAFVLFIPSQNVYAEYNDLNENTLVNFNQLYDYSKFAGSSLLQKIGNGQYLINTTIGGGVNWVYLNVDYNNRFNGHKLFLTVGYRHDNYPYPTIGFGNDIGAKWIYGSGIIDGTSEFKAFFRIDNGTYNNVVLTPMIIDLTQMFGSGNEPTLEQCYEYFPTYYPYNNGTEMPFSKSYLQGYQEGAQSVYESLTITFNSYTIGANSQTYANNTIERGELAFDQQYSAYSFSGVIAINLLGQVERGTNINIDFELTIPSLEGEPNVETFAEKFILYFAYVDSNNNLVNITGVKPKYKGGWANSYKGDFALPITTSTIYCYLNYNTIGDNFLPTTAIATKSDITFKGLDLAQVVNNAYNKGASDTNAKYSVGGLLYQSIYDLGKSEGIAEGNSFATGLDVIATTFTKVFSIFNIEILPGVPLTIFILLPLLFGLIMFIVKLTKGG